MPNPKSFSRRVAKADTSTQSAIGLLLLWGGLVFFITAPILVAAPFAAAKRDRNMELYGAPATAEVRKLYCSSGKGPCNYMVTYTYDVGDGRTRWGDSGITPDQAAAIRQGMTRIPIAHDCRDPGVVLPNFGNRLHINARHAGACPAPRR
jgi:hypothetical protein